MLETILPLAACVGIGAALTYGAITDYKSRIIPNAVPITIMACGIFTSIPWSMKLSNFIIMVLALVVVGALTKQKSGGGDLKLYCSLSFALGLFAVAILLAMTIIIKKAHAVLVVRKRDEKGARFPLCTFLAPAYGIYLSYIIGSALGAAL